MGKAKFTEGEWKVTDGHYPSIIEIKCGECMRIPVVLSATDITFEQGLEREANAHLIAATPEMYEEIEREYSALLWEIQNFVCEDETDEKKLRKLQVAADRKANILAKARGEL